MSSNHQINVNPYHDDRVKITTSLAGMLVRLWPYFMRHRWTFVASVSAVVAVAITSRLSITLLGYAIDHGITRNDRNIVIWAAVGYLVLELTRHLMTFLHGIIFARLANRVLFEIRHEIIEHLQSLPLGYFDKNPTGRIVTRVTSDPVSLGDVFTQGLINMFIAMISLLSIIIALLLISVKVTILTLIVAPPVVWFMYVLSTRIFAILRESRKKMAELNSSVAENVSGMRVLQLYDSVEKNRARFYQLSTEYKDLSISSIRLYAFLWPLVSILTMTSVATALFFGGQLVLTGAVTTGAMVAFILHLRSLSDPVNTLLEQYQNLQNSLSGAERVFTLLGEKAETNHEAPARLPKTKLAGEIQFKNVSFRYERDLPLALKGVNLRVTPGSSVALVGRTGSGKTTLISLLQRFYDLNEGQIFIDHLDLNNIPRRELRSRLGVVQQDNFLFRGTVAANISLNDPRITPESIERAAELACLTDLISRRPSSLQSMVEERGSNLSFGERQLIAFARVLAFDPDILILDEATSNIDSYTESLIQEATRRVRQGRTSFIIAHRLSTIVDCDQIVLLENGQIVEQGTHSELLAKKGAYAALYQAQAAQPQDTAAT